VSDDARPPFDDPADPLARRAERATESRVRALETGLTWHLHRLERAADAGRRELEYAAEARRERITQSPKLDPVGVDQIQRLLAKLRAQARYTRVGVVVAVAVAVAAGAGLYFGAPQDTGGGHAQSRPSVHWRAPSSLGATPTPSTADTAPELAPPSDSTAPPATRESGTGRGQTRAPASSIPATSGRTSPSPPGTSTPGTSSPPPSSPPQSPLCQLVPGLC